MATWEDGPEYAPVARPAGFETPAVPPLDVAPPRPRPSAGAPVAVPDFRQVQPAIPLDQLAPQQGPERDPVEEFAVASSTLTEPDSAWGAVAHHHANAQSGWAPPTGAPVGPAPGSDAHFEMPHPEAVHGPPLADPHAPITLTQGRRRMTGDPLGAAPNFPPPDQLGYGPPPVQGQGLIPSAPVRLTPATWLSATRPATVALLVLGGLFWIISPLCFAAAAWSAWQVRQRSDWVRNAVMVGASMLGVTAVLALVMAGADLFTTWDLLGKVSLVVCWLELGVIAAIVAMSLARGEQPEQWS